MHWLKYIVCHQISIDALASNATVQLQEKISLPQFTSRHIGTEERGSALCFLDFAIRKQLHILLFV